MGQCLSHKSMLGGNNKTIEFVVEKAFLEAVEKQNKSRNDIVCVDVCDTLPDLFGTPGSTVRRALQQHWKNLKNRTIKSYANYLVHYLFAAPAVVVHYLFAAPAVAVPDLSKTVLSFSPLSLPVSKLF